MDRNTLAQIAYNYAKQNQWNRKGRILVTEFRKDMNEPLLTYEEIVQALRESFPTLKIEQRDENMILIQF